MENALALLKEEWTQFGLNQARIAEYVENGCPQSLAERFYVILEAGTPVAVFLEQHLLPGVPEGAPLLHSTRLAQVLCNRELPLDLLEKLRMAGAAMLDQALQRLLPQEAGLKVKLSLATTALEVAETVNHHCLQQLGLDSDKRYLTSQELKSYPSDHPSSAYLQALQASAISQRALDPQAYGLTPEKELAEVAQVEKKGDEAAEAWAKIENLLFYHPDRVSPHIAMCCGVAAELPPFNRYADSEQLRAAAISFSPQERQEILRLAADFEAREPDLARIYQARGLANWLRGSDREELRILRLAAETFIAARGQFLEEIERLREAGRPVEEVAERHSSSSLRLEATAELAETEQQVFQPDEGSLLATALRLTPTGERSVLTRLAVLIWDGEKFEAQFWEGRLATEAERQVVLLELEAARRLLANSRRLEEGIRDLLAAEGEDGLFDERLGLGPFGEKTMIGQASLEGECLVADLSPDTTGVDPEQAALAYERTQSLTIQVQDGFKHTLLEWRDPERPDRDFRRTVLEELATGNVAILEEELSV